LLLGEMEIMELVFVALVTGSGLVSKDELFLDCYQTD
jgi:hypothetical protein